MVSTISRRECIHQTTLNCNITPNISSILQRLFHGGRTEAARQHGDKTKEMLVCFPKDPPPPPPAVPPIELVKTESVRVQQTKFLGVVLSSDLNCILAGTRGLCVREGVSTVVFPTYAEESRGRVKGHSQDLRVSGELSTRIRVSGLAHLANSTASDQLEALQRRALRIAYPNNSFRESLLLTELNTSYRRRTASARAFFTDMLRLSCKLYHLIPLQRAHGCNLSFSRLNYSIINTGRVGNLLLDMDWQ